MAATAHPKPKADRRKLLLIAAVAVIAFVLLRRKLTGASTATVATAPATLDTSGNGTVATGITSSPDLLSAQVDALAANADTLAGRLAAVESVAAVPGPTGATGATGDTGPAGPPPGPAPTPQPVVHAPVATPTPPSAAAVVAHKEFVTKQVAQKAAGGVHTAGF
jgi:hypothetical protein